MRTLALFLINLEKLVQNPAMWVVAPLLCLVSIVSYTQLQAYLGKVDAVEVDTHQAVMDLKKEVKEFHQVQLAELAKITPASDRLASQSAQELVLGLADPNLATSTATQMVYIPKNFSLVEVFDQPSPQAKKITAVTGDTVYFFTQHQNGWYQIELDHNLMGWIRQEFAQELP